VGARAAALADTFGPDVDPDATAKLGGGGGPGAASEAVASASGGYLRLKLTQTGATLGTPAYMAPEQFAGTGGDARSDQFSFCVALYEGVYGRRPFAGDNPLALMSNVVAGTVTEPPPEARVPSWIRRILLRGLSTDPKQRHGSMTELLTALGQDPAVRRRRWLAAATAALFVAGAAAGAHRFSAGQHAICAGGPGRAATAWSPERRGAIERAFAATGNRNAARAFANAAALIDGYVARWTGMYTETCQATHVRGEQSADVLDLRMGCLGERLTSVRALGDVFSSADSGVVDNAVAAASALPALDRCADVAMLRAVIRPPDDPTVRAKVAAVSEEVAKVKALGDSGQCDKAVTEGGTVVAAADATGYPPLEAEAHLAVGRLGETCTDVEKAISELEAATFAAESSRHDQVFVEATLNLAGLYSDRLHDTRRARDTLGHSRAVLSRFPGHPVLEAWLADVSATIFMDEGRFEEALREEQKSLTLREAAFGPSHFEVANSAANIALDLHELRRDSEAEPLMARAVGLLDKLFGGDSTRLALLLMDHAEILTSLGQFHPADAAINRALTTFRKQSASQFMIGYGLLDLGRLQVAEGDARTAAATLEKSLALLADQDPRTTAEAEFALARALWSDSAPSRRRADGLATRAHASAVKEPGSKRLIADIEDWRREHHLR
jgi:serine/threonine-protein kinase